MTASVESAAVTSRSDTPVLQAEDVAVHYAGIKAVNGVSLALAPGRIYGIVGPNGSGKSTLLAALTRLVRLTRGRLMLDGEDYTSASNWTLARQGVARTFQTVRVLPHLTVAENIQLGADLLPRGSGRERWRRFHPLVDEAMARTGLTELRDVRPTELSYGTQRRIEIARALASRPRLLMLDEPTAGMNQVERREVATLLRKLRDEGLTQLLIEHDVQMMVETCDRLGAMNFGVLLTEGPPADVVRNPAVQEAYLGKKWHSRA